MNGEKRWAGPAKHDDSGGDDGARELSACPRGCCRRVRAGLALVQSLAVLQTLDAGAWPRSRRGYGRREDAWGEVAGRVGAVLPPCLRDHALRGPPGDRKPDGRRSLRSDAVDRISGDHPRGFGALGKQPGEGGRDPRGRLAREAAGDSDHRDSVAVASSRAVDVLPRYAVQILLPLTVLAPAQVVSQVTIEGLRVEYLTNPIGIDVVQPRLSWRIASTRRNTMQAAYQLQVDTSETRLTRGANPLWDSGKVASDTSVFVEYRGPATVSRTRYYWRVRVWDTSGRGSPWSPAAFWETGLLQPADWTAQWIGPPPTAADSLPSPSPLLRRAFRVGDAVRSARLYVTSLGLYEVYLNGQRVGTELFTPGWTSYRRRLQYQTYDVTPLLRPGANVVGAMLGDGWYRGHLGFFGQRNLYGRRLGLRAQLEIRYESGRTERIVSDMGWKTTPGPVLASDIYGGETYDARRELIGWTSAPFDDHGWAAVALVDPPPATLVATLSPPVRREIGRAHV